MERVEHLFEGLPALYTILTLLPTVAVTGTTVSHGWKTNVATLDDLVNLTLSLPSIPFFFFFSPSLSSWSSSWEVAREWEIQVRSL